MTSLLAGRAVHRLRSPLTEDQAATPATNRLATIMGVACRTAPYPTQRSAAAAWVNRSFRGSLQAYEARNRAVAIQPIESIMRPPPIGLPPHG